MSADDEDSAESPWIPVDPRARSGPISEPQLTVYQNGEARVNAAGDRMLLEGAPAVELLIDPAADRLAIEPVNDESPDYYTITRSNSDAGGEIRLQKALSRLAIYVDDLSESHQLPLDLVDGRGIVDLDPLCQDVAEDDNADEDIDEQLDEPDAAGAEADDSGDTDADDADEPTPEERLARATKIAEEEADDSSSIDARTRDDGLVIERVRQALAEHGELSGPELKQVTGHGDSIYDAISALTAADDIDKRKDPDDARRTLYALPDGEPSLEVVRDCAQIVETVQALADLLDISEAQARGLAADAGVRSDLREDRSPMGVSG